MSSTRFPSPARRSCWSSRASVYNLPRATPQADLGLGRRIDELHLNHPFAGSRMLRDLLRHEGFSVGRKHVDPHEEDGHRSAVSPS